MTTKRLVLATFLFVAMMSQLLVSCHAQATVAGETPAHQGLQTGAEVLMDNTSRLSAVNRQRSTLRVAVVGNQTSVVGNTHLVDTLLASGADIRKIFCP